MQTINEINNSLSHSRKITREAYDALHKAVEAKDWRLVMKMCVGSCYNDIRDIRNCAMNAFFGPVSLHESMRDDDGRPTADALARYPAIGEGMKLAEDHIHKFYLWRVRECAESNSKESA